MKTGDAARGKRGREANPFPDPTAGNANYHFHSSRAERTVLAEETCPPDARGKGMFGWVRRNRGLSITLLDIVVITVIIILFLTVLRPNLAVDSTGDGLFRGRLSAFRFDGYVYAEIEIDRDETGELGIPADAGFAFFLTSASDGLSRGAVKDAFSGESGTGHHSLEFPRVFPGPCVSWTTFRDLLPAPGERGEYTEVFDLAEIFPSWSTEGEMRDEGLNVWAVVLIEGISPIVTTVQAVD